MTMILSVLTQLLHIGLVLAAAPTLAGVTSWLNARMVGRNGPSMLMPWRDLLRQVRKTPVTMDTVSAVSRYAPALSLGTTLSAAALVPSFTLGMAFAAQADVLIIVALLIAARVVGALAALDTGAALPGLSQQRASALAVLTEPTLILSVVAPALMGGSFNLDALVNQQRQGMLLPAAASALTLTSLLALALAEFSDCDEHSSQMCSGVQLAMTWMTAWLRRLIWIDLIGALFLPIGMAVAEGSPLDWMIGLATWVIRLALAVAAMSLTRTIFGQVARQSLPDLVGVAALLALLAIVIVLASTGLA